MYNCKECREEYDPNNHKGIKDLCFKCWFWIGHIREVYSSMSVRVGGQHYRLSNPVMADPERAGLGHGGAKFLIEFEDGRVVETNNLWHQGEIPERFSDRLPTNAKFLEGAWR